MRKNLVAIAGLLAATLLFWTSSAWPADPQIRRMGVHVQNGTVLATFGYRDIFTHAVRDKLKSGLPTRIVLQIFLEKDGKPIAFWARSTSIVYDLWEEAFIVVDEDSRGWRKARSQSPAEVINLAGMLKQAPVAELNSLDPGTYRLRTIIEVNPVSKQMIANIQRWLARPSLSKGGVVDNQSNFFGSFVGIFVDRHIGEADHRLIVMSQSFSLGQP